jgi:hypothetical protein
MKTAAIYLRSPTCGIAFSVMNWIQAGGTAFAESAKKAATENRSANWAIGR